MYRHRECFFSFFRNCLTQTLTLTLDLGHRVRTKWDEGPNLTPTRFTAIFDRVAVFAVQLTRVAFSGVESSLKRLSVQKQMGYSLF